MDYYEKEDEFFESYENNRNPESIIYNNIEKEEWKLEAMKFDSEEYLLGIDEDSELCHWCEENKGEFFYNNKPICPKCLEMLKKAGL